jgi:hypothetical protein
VVVVAWISALLGTDTVATRKGEWLLGALTWLLLAALLSREDMLVRLQVGVVVAFATAVEYGFSAGLGVYSYRHGGVPAFVPPGHGLVYLAALDIGRSGWLRRNARPARVATSVTVAAWALWGLILAPRLDVLGAFWAGCLLVFMRWGRSPLTYVGAFLVVSWLEILGTATGAWTWAPWSPTGLVAQGNPPSGAAGGYCWFDAAALWLGPLLLARWQSRRSGERALA